MDLTKGDLVLLQKRPQWSLLLQDLIFLPVPGSRRASLPATKYAIVNRARTANCIRENIRIEFGLPKMGAVMATNGKAANVNIVRSLIIFLCCNTVFSNPY